MSLFEDTNPRELKVLLQQINSGESVLPDFQRDFVWDASATQELIASIAHDYPAGSLLRIRNTKNLFAFREFEGAPSLNGGRPTYLVLDGQQRLTSLYQAFFGVGEHRYYLDISKLLGGADFEEAIFHLRANHKQVKQFETLEVQASKLVLPLKVLRGGAGEFGRWTRNVARSQNDRDKFEEQISEVEEHWIRIVDDYRFPVVTLSDQTGPDAVCTIFETLNRTGVKLTAFELLTARFWPMGINLRELWDKATKNLPIIADFEIDPYYLLQVICLCSRPTPSCKRSDVLGLSPEVLTQWWEPATLALGKALEILRDDCGVIVPRWLPYNTMLIPCAAVLAKHGEHDAAEVGGNRQKLCRWFWCSVFSQAYENAPNFQSVKDFSEILAWMGGGAAPQTVNRFNFDASVLRETTTRQRALYRGVIALILRNGPRDFHNGRKITGDLMIEQNIDDHHIFPNAWLGRQDVPSRLRDCVLNRTLIDRKTNIRISDRSPSDYLAEVSQCLGNDAFHRLLQSHVLPDKEMSALLKDDFEGFLEWREKAIGEEIRRVTS